MCLRVAVNRTAKVTLPKVGVQIVKGFYNGDAPLLRVEESNIVLKLE